MVSGLSSIVSSKYKAYCNKVIELRRRKAQLQLLQTQKERSELRSLERSLVPSAAGAFEATLEGPLVRMSSITSIWWECYARLDSKRRILLFTDSKSDRIKRSITSHARAVALSKYALVHELQDSYAQRPAAFEIVPKRPELPVITLASDGSMTTRRWVCAIQQAIDDASHDDEDGGTDAGSFSTASSVSHQPVMSHNSHREEQSPPHLSSHEDGIIHESGGAGSALGGSPGGGSLSNVLSVVPTALLPFAAKLEQVIEYSSQRVDQLATQKVDEFDRQFGSTMGEQVSRVEAIMSQLSRERDALGEVVVSALDDFEDEAAENLNSQLLAMAQAQLKYHTSAATHLQQLCAVLQARAPTSTQTVRSSGRKMASHPSSVADMCSSPSTTVAVATIVHEPPIPAPPAVLFEREASQDMAVVHVSAENIQVATGRPASPPAHLVKHHSSQDDVVHEGIAPPPLQAPEDVPSADLASASSISEEKEMHATSSRLSPVLKGEVFNGAKGVVPETNPPSAFAATNFFDEDDDGAHQIIE